MSLIYIMKNSGPRIDPCGTPILVNQVMEFSILAQCIMGVELRPA